jgi:hypothetical protein
MIGSDETHHFFQCSVLSPYVAEISFPFGHNILQLVQREFQSCQLGESGYMPFPSRYSQPPLYPFSAVAYVCKSQLSCWVLHNPLHPNSVCPCSGSCLRDTKPASSRTPSYWYSHVYIRRDLIVRVPYLLQDRTRNIHVSVWLSQSKSL